MGGKRLVLCLTWEPTMWWVFLLRCCLPSSSILAARSTLLFPFSSLFGFFSSSLEMSDFGDDAGAVVWYNMRVERSNVRFNGNALEHGLGS